MLPDSGGSIHLENVGRTDLFTHRNLRVFLALSLAFVSSSLAQEVRKPDAASPATSEQAKKNGTTSTAAEEKADREGQHDAAKKAARKAQEAAKKAQKAPLKASSSKSALKQDKTIGQSEASKKLRANWDSPELRAPKKGYPWIEHEGYLRMRADMFHGFDLGTFDPQNRTGTSPFYPPLTEIDETGDLSRGGTDSLFGQGAESLSSANIRFRYQPTIHVSESLRINTTLDVFDNLVLGSTPFGGPHASRYNTAESDTFALPDPAIGLFNDSQRPTDSGINGQREAIRVKHLWGEWKSPLASVAFGRMPNHWGLGIMANAGQCIDCDFGDAVDRLMGTILLFDTYLAIGWDFADEGAVGFSGDQNFQNQPYGQPFDLDQRDDISQYTIAIFRRPVSRKEKQMRRRKLYEKHEIAFDWGLYNVIRSQTLESGYNLDGLGAGQPLEYQLFRVDGFTYSPDLWLDLNWVPDSTTTYRLQLEVVGVFGTVEEVPQLFDQDRVICPDGTDPANGGCDGEAIEQRKRDVNRFGYALEFDATNGAFEWGFHHGMASGDENEGFGYLRNSEIQSAGSQTAIPDQSLTALRFDRDYHVDLILFRELIGGVTNAMYFKPYLGYRFIDQTSEKWGFKLSALYGHALEAEATPGDDPSLGVELDLEVYIHEIDRFQLRFMYGLLLPMSAFDRVNENGVVIAEPETAQTLQALIGIEF